MPGNPVDLCHCSARHLSGTTPQPPHFSHANCAASASVYHFPSSYPIRPLPPQTEHLTHMMSSRLVNIRLPLAPGPAVSRGHGFPPFWQRGHWSLTTPKISPSFAVCQCRNPTAFAHILSKRGSFRRSTFRWMMARSWSQSERDLESWGAVI